MDNLSEMATAAGRNVSNPTAPQGAEILKQPPETMMDSMIRIQNNLANRLTDVRIRLYSHLARQQGDFPTHEDCEVEKEPVGKIGNMEHIQGLIGNNLTEIEGMLDVLERIA